MSSHVSYERVCQNLEELKLTAALTELDDVLGRGQKQDKLPVEVLDDLLERERRARFERRVKANFQFARLPTIKRIEDFDFDAQAEVPKQTIEELATLRFVHHGENVVFVGPCGVGKTHLAIGLAVRTLEAGHRAYFTSLHDLVTKARAARDKNRLSGLVRNIKQADLFVLDELGFLPLDATDATFLFEIINKRYQASKPTIVTSNKPFGQWGEIFPDHALAVALLDRLLHHCTTVNIRGESYRLRHRKAAGLTSPDTFSA